MALSGLNILRSCFSQRRNLTYPVKSCLFTLWCFTSAGNEPTFKIHGHTNVSSACKMLVRNMCCSVSSCFLLHRDVGLRHHTSDAPAAKSWQSVEIRHTSRLKLFPQKWVRWDLQSVWFCPDVVGTVVRCSDELRIKGSEQLLHPPILDLMPHQRFEIPQIWQNQLLQMLFKYVIKKHKTGSWVFLDGLIKYYL